MSLFYYHLKCITFIRNYLQFEAVAKNIPINDKIGQSDHELRCVKLTDSQGIYDQDLKVVDQLRNLNSSSCNHNKKEYFLIMR